MNDTNDEHEGLFDAIDDAVIAKNKMTVGKLEVSLRNLRNDFIS